MYTLKSIVRRGSMLGAAVAIVASVFAPASAVFADALNPLTERSLLLSSSAPGYTDTDGSGNSTAFPNAVPTNYAPAGSGPNGRKTGETFSFKVSTNSTLPGADTIQGFTFQYCTKAAGYCAGPGNNTGDASSGVNNRQPNGDAERALGHSDLDAELDSAVIGTNFVIRADLNNDGDFADTDEVITSGWDLETKTVEDEDYSGPLTGKRNFIVLSAVDPALNDIVIVNGGKIIVEFLATETQYITNPGDGSFFVKINTYSTNDPDLMLPDDDTNIIDGGVTVANVMTDSIHITTKVLETMSFSVGTRNRDTLALNCGVDFGQPTQPDGCEAASGATHGTCSPIQNINNNRLNLGNADAEYSLETDTSYDVYSYWRLSSNSSGGATVYYSGNTLANTVGDEIAPIGATPQVSTQGTEQFGLAFVDAGADDFDADFDALVAAGTTGHKTPTLLLDDLGTVPTGDDIYLAPEPAYANGEGSINGSEDALFAFVKESNETPELIAENGDTVISCATAKMRYVANIGADTPAGVYTTKINYLAAPQY